MGKTTSHERTDLGPAPRGFQIESALQTLATTLRQLRSERGFRLVDLAAATGLSEVHLYRLEQGDRAPSIAALLTLASVYGVDPAHLLNSTTRQRRVTRHRGKAVWEGRESSGSGTMVAHGASVRYDVASRLKGSHGQPAGDGTVGSPEQLIGTALAGCFSMSLAERLDAAGFEPQRIETTAEVLLAVNPGGVAINEIRLDCSAGVDGIDETRLDEIAQLTKRTCVVSRALMAVPVTLTVQLASPARGRRPSPTTQGGESDGNQDPPAR